ncbi:ribonuclease HI family protein [Candidatus Dojkabacteria bacterium]|nr:ribonuclease HI family protein [Candidatus Dojkabacteria bacterium]
MNFKLFTDGGSRGNPGSSAAAFLLFNDNDLIDLGAKFLGSATNNFAEYNALIEGLKLAKKHTDSVACFLDSELVVKQINGEYKVSSADIKPLVSKVKELAKDFSSISFTHVPRAENKHADKLVNIILDSLERDNV